MGTYAEPERKETLCRRGFPGGLGPCVNAHDAAALQALQVHAWASGARRKLSVEWNGAPEPRDNVATLRVQVWRRFTAQTNPYAWLVGWLFRRTVRSLCW